MTSLYHFMTSLCMVSSKHESTRVNESLKKLITFLIINSTFSVNQKYERMWYVRILWPFIYKLRPFWEKLVGTYGHSTWRTTLSNCTKQCGSPITYHDITIIFLCVIYGYIDKQNPMLQKICRYLRYEIQDGRRGTAK